MSNFELFRFTRVRPAAKRTESVDPEGRGIEPPASNTYVDEVNRAVVDGGSDVRTIRRQVAHTYLAGQFSDNAVSARSWAQSAERAAAAIATAASSGDETRFAQELQSIFPEDANLESLRDNAWSSFYASLFAEPPRSEILAATTTWIRAVHLLDVETSNFRRYARRKIGQLCPRLHHDLVDTLDESEVSNQPGSDPASQDQRARILSQRNQIENLREARETVESIITKKRNMALAREASRQVSLLREYHSLASSGRSQDSDTSGAGRTRRKSPLKSKPPIDPLVISSKDIASAPDWDQVERALRHADISIDAQSSLETLELIDAAIARESRTLASLSSKLVPAVVAGQIVWRRRFISVAEED